MPKYLVQANYTTEGAKSFARDGGTGRREAIAKMAESVGGKLETLYFAFGDVVPTSSLTSRTTFQLPLFGLPQTEAVL